MLKQMQFFRKIKFGSIPVCIENCQNIVTGREWRSRNPEFAYFPIEGLFGVVRPSNTHKKYNFQYLNDFLSGNGLGTFLKLVIFTFRHIYLTDRNLKIQCLMYN